MNTKKLTKNKWHIYGTLCIFAALAIAYFGGKAYNAPTYELIENHTDTYSVAYTQADGLRVKDESMRLAWHNTDAGHQLYYYNPETEEAVKVGNTKFIEEITPSLEKSKYGAWRYTGIWAYLIIGIVAYFALLILGTMIGELVFLCATLAHPTTQRCIDYLNDTPIFGKKAVEKKFRNSLPALAAAKRTEWQKRFKPEYYVLFNSVLNYMEKTGTLDIPYHLTYTDRTHAVAGLEGPMMADMPNGDITKVDTIVSHLMNVFLKERLFTFEARKNSPVHIFVDVEAINTDRPFTPSVNYVKREFVGVTLKLSMYFFLVDKEGNKTRYNLHQTVMPSYVNYTYSSDDFSESGLYSNIMSETLDKYGEYLSKQIKK